MSGDAPLGALVFRDFGLQSHVRPGQFRRALLHPQLQLIARATQRRVAFLNLGQHLIERIGEESGLIPTLFLRPDGIVLAFGDALGGLRQSQDRFGDRPLQAGGKRHSHNERPQQHQADDAAK